MKQSETLTYDVLIVGAGPAGVVSANLLGKHGVRVLLIDKEADVVEIPRAVGLCNEGSRILNAAGLMKKIEENILDVQQVQFRDENMEPFFSVDCSEKVNGYNIIRTIYQPDLERSMRKALDDYHSVDFWVNTECLQIQDADGLTPGAHNVSCRLMTRNEDIEGNVEGYQYRNIRCRYVLGCDGARSSIRKMMGVEFSGHTYSQDWLIVDINNDPENHVHNLHKSGKTNDRDIIYFMCDPERPGVTLPTPDGTRRWEFVVKKGESHETITSDQSIKKLLAPWGDAEKMGVTRKAIYTFHARIAKQFRVGNVFLVGDAAHLTPPFAGQGLMAGLRDAYNISWKLASVIRGTLPDEFLDSYHEERHPQAVIIVNLARTLGMLILPQRRWISGLRNSIFNTYNKLTQSDASYALKKTPNSTLGLKSLRRGLGDITELTVGYEFLQSIVTKQPPKAGVTPLLVDDVLPSDYTVISYGESVESHLSASVREHFLKISGRFCVIDGVDPGRSIAKGAAISASDVQLYDCANYYRPLFDSGRKIVVIRPDKMVVVCCDKRNLDKSLRKYLLSINVMTQEYVQSA